MARACTCCGCNPPEAAFFCPACGTPLEQIAGVEITALRTERTALGIALPLPQTHLLLPHAHAASFADPSLAHSQPPATSAPKLTLASFLRPVIGFCFGLAFLFGTAEYIVLGGLPGYGLWPLPVLVGGELLAQEAWINGRVWSGLPGMLLWCILIWLASAIAAGRI